MRAELGRNDRSTGINSGFFCMELIIGIMKGLPGRNEGERNRGGGQSFNKYPQR